MRKKSREVPLDHRPKKKCETIDFAGNVLFSSSLVVLFYFLIICFFEFFGGVDKFKSRLAGFHFKTPKKKKQKPKST